MYKNLRTNIPTSVMQSPDLDFEQGVPSYISKAQLGSYIERYAEHFGVAPLARFGAAVTSVTPSRRPDTGDLWEVEWRSFSNTIARLEHAVS